MGVFICGPDIRYTWSGLLELHLYMTLWSADDYDAEFLDCNTCYMPDETVLAIADALEINTPKMDPKCQEDLQRHIRIWSELAWQVRARRASEMQMSRDEFDDKDCDVGDCDHDHGHPISRKCPP